MKIITDLKLLRQKSVEVIPEEVQNIIKKLEDSLDLDRGIGLSGIQIGILKKISIIRYNDIKLNLINAKIIRKFDKFRFKQERCLSIPGISIDTIRYKQIIVENNKKQYEFDINTDGIICIVIQHEIDHTNGLLMIDRKWRKRK